MRTNAFWGEYAMRITFALALVAVTCSLLIACHPAVVAKTTAGSSGSSGNAGNAGQSSELRTTDAPPARAVGMEPVLAFDEKWVGPF